MKYIDEYRNKDLISKLVNRIHRYSEREYTFMEVCGGHTMAINRFGIPSLLPRNIRLKSGPGCPVCVTGKSYIDKAIAYSRMKDVIVCSYGDLLKVPGSTSSLYKEKAAGADVRMVYSLMDALKIARQHPGQKVVFLAIGFETTAPGSAVGLLEAEKEGLDNFYLFSSHKLMPPAMEAIVEEGIKIDGFICPGHVSTITGKEIYTQIPEAYGLACVITGFEPLDILQSILMLIQQLENHDPKVDIQYKRAVRQDGNIKAREYMNQVFEPRDDWWRGLGMLKKSGLGIRKKYRDFDAEHEMPLETKTEETDRGCICGDILKGLKEPVDCKLFGTGCTSLNPVGACMVSSEGACQAYYKYRKHE